MKVKSVSWRGIRVPLRESLATTAGIISERSSLLIRLHTDLGITGIGEAPTPLNAGHLGLTRLDSTLDSLSSKLIGTPLDAVSAQVSSLLASSSDAAALHFALETASLDAIGQDKGIPLSSLLGGRPRPVPVNALIGGASLKQAVRQASQAVADGYQTIKVKVGIQPANEEMSVLKAIRIAIGNDVKLRLDANRAWDLEGVDEHLQRLEVLRPEYVEEPVKTARFSDLAQLRSCSPIPIALDETLDSRGAVRRAIRATAADVFILKAARLGGIIETQSVISAGAEWGVKTVITSSLETGIGLAASLHLASAALDASEVCGLSTGALLEHDLLTSPLAPREGLLTAPSSPGLGVTLDREAMRRYSVAIEGRIGE